MQMFFYVQIVQIFLTKGSAMFCIFKSNRSRLASHPAAQPGTPNTQALLRRQGDAMMIF